MKTMCVGGPFHGEQIEVTPAPPRLYVNNCTYEQVKLVVFGRIMTVYGVAGLGEGRRETAVASALFGATAYAVWSDSPQVPPPPQLEPPWKLP